MAVLAVQAGTAWREYVFDTRTQPAFASLGFVTVRADSDRWFVKPPGQEKAAAGSAHVGTRKQPKALSAIHSAKPFKGRVIAVDGRNVVGQSAQSVAGLLDQAGDGPVKLTLLHIGKKKRLGAETLTLTPSIDQRQKVYAKDDRTFKIATQLVDLVLALLLIAASVLVRARYFKNATYVGLAFVLLWAATVGSSRLWQYLGVVDGIYYCYLVWMSLLLALLPAWPDGHYRPAWTRWTMVLGPIASLAIFANRTAIERSSIVTAAVVTMVALPISLFVAERFRLETDRRERQRLKWVFLGFAFGLLCVMVGLLIPETGSGLPERLAPFARYGTFVLRRLGILLIVGGLLLSLARYRLNDTDALIGRSTAYATLMTALAVIWAVGEALTDNAVKAFAGASNQTLALSVSTIVTVAVLAPVRERMLQWTQAYFQRGLIRLQELPQKLARWHWNMPERIAERALSAIVTGVDPSWAALLWEDPQTPPQPLALHNLTPAQLDEILTGERDVACYAFDADADGSTLKLFVGRRADGASYTREERRSLGQLLEPLADALQASLQRKYHEVTLAGAIEDLHARIRSLHGARKRSQSRRRGELKVVLP